MSFKSADEFRSEAERRISGAMEQTAAEARAGAERVSRHREVMERLLPEFFRRALELAEPTTVSGSRRERYSMVQGYRLHVSPRTEFEKSVSTYVTGPPLRITERSPSWPHRVKTYAVDDLRVFSAEDNYRIAPSIVTAIWADYTEAQVHRVLEGLLSTYANQAASARRRP